MILLFFLTGKFPLFQSNDDTEALMEIAVVIGRNKMEKAATLHSKLLGFYFCSPHLTMFLKVASSQPTYLP